MGYSVTFKDNTFDLPDYTLDIADKLEQVLEINKSNQSFRIKCRKMYDFISSMIGAENTESCLGKFNACDPNDITILFLEISNQFNKPFDEYTANSTESLFGEEYMDKVFKLVEMAEKAKRLTK